MSHQLPDIIPEFFHGESILPLNFNVESDSSDEYCNDPNIPTILPTTTTDNESLVTLSSTSQHPSSLDTLSTTSLPSQLSSDDIHLNELFESIDVVSDIHDHVSSTNSDASSIDSDFEFKLDELPIEFCDGHRGNVNIESLDSCTAFEKYIASSVEEKTDKDPVNATYIELMQPVPDFKESSNPHIKAMEWDCDLAPFAGILYLFFSILLFGGFYEMSEALFKALMSILKYLQKEKLLSERVKIPPSIASLKVQQKFWPQFPMS